MLRQLFQRLDRCLPPLPPPPPPHTPSHLNKLSCCLCGLQRLTFLHIWTRWYAVISTTCNFCFSKLFGPNGLESRSTLGRMCSCTQGASCAKRCSSVFVQRLIRNVLLSDCRRVKLCTHSQFPRTHRNCFDTVQIPLFFTRFSPSCSGSISRTPDREQLLSTALTASAAWQECGTKPTR